MRIFLPILLALQLDGAYILSRPFTPEPGPVDPPHADDADAWGICRVTRVRVVSFNGLPVGVTTYDASPWITWQHRDAYGPQTTDLNADGFVNGDDLDAFMIAFEAGCPCADFDGNGFVNGDDVDLYQAMYENGVITP